MIKQLFFTLLFSFYFSNVDAQYFNSIYNYMGAPEFEQDIHLLDNSNLIEIGAIRLDKNSIIIRELDSTGNLLWSDIAANDSLDLYSAWTHTSTIKDTILFMIATAQKFDVYLFSPIPIF